MMNFKSLVMVSDLGRMLLDYRNRFCVCSMLMCCSGERKNFLDDVRLVQRSNQTSVENVSCRRQSRTKMQRFVGNSMVFLDLRYCAI